MNKLIRYIFILFFTTTVQFSVLAQEKYTLEQMIQMAKSQSPFSKQAETRKENRYWSYRLFRSNYNPQLKLTGNLPDYNRDYIQNLQNDGTYKVQQQNRSNGAVNLGLEQPIALTGGYSIC